MATFVKSRSTRSASCAIQLSIRPERKLPVSWGRLLRRIVQNLPAPKYRSTEPDFERTGEWHDPDQELHGRDASSGRAWRALARCVQSCRPGYEAGGGLLYV